MDYRGINGHTLIYVHICIYIYNLYVAMHYLVWCVTPITDQQLNCHHKMPTWNKNPLSNILITSLNICSLSYEAGTYVQSIFQGLFQVHMPQHGKNAWACCVFLTLGLWDVLHFDVLAQTCEKSSVVKMKLYKFQLDHNLLHFRYIFCSSIWPHDPQKAFSLFWKFGAVLTWTNNQQIVYN